MSSNSNQGYLSSEVDLFVSSTNNSVHVVILAFLWGVWVFCMPKVLDLMWQVSFYHGDIDLLGSALSYSFVLGP